MCCLSMSMSAKDNRTVFWTETQNARYAILWLLLFNYRFRVYPDGSHSSPVPGASISGQFAVLKIKKMSNQLDFHRSPRLLAIPASTQAVWVLCMAYGPSEEGTFLSCFFKPVHRSHTYILSHTIFVQPFRRDRKIYVEQKRIANTTHSRQMPFFPSHFGHVFQIDSTLSSSKKKNPLISFYLIRHFYYLLWASACVCGHRCCEK